MRKIVAIVLCLVLVNPVFAFSFDFSDFKDRFVLFFTFDDTKKAERMLDIAEKKLEESSKVGDLDKKEEIMDEYQNYVERAEDIAEDNNDSSLINRVNVVRGKSEIREVIPTQASNVSNRSDTLEKRLPRVNIGSIGKEEKEITHVNINKTDVFCIQVIQPARNVETGECKEFPTPCDVPVGWEKIPSCKSNSIAGQKDMFNDPKNTLNNVLDSSNRQKKNIKPEIPGIL